MLRSFTNRALCLAVFAALLATTTQTYAQSFTIFPEKKITLKALPGALVTEALAFSNNTDKEVSITAAFGSDSTIGIDLPKVIVLKPREKCEYIISYLGL